MSATKSPARVELIRNLEGAISMYTEMLSAPEYASEEDQVHLQRTLSYYRQDLRTAQTVRHLPKHLRRSVTRA